MKNNFSGYNMRSIIYLTFVVGLSLFTLPCFSSAENPALTFQVIEAEINFNGLNIESATVVKEENHQYALKIKLKPSAADELTRITNLSIGKHAIIVFNGKIISITRIQSPLGASFLVVGLSKEDAEKVVRSIKKSHQ